MKRELKVWINDTAAEVVQDAQRIVFVYSIDGTTPGAVGGSYAKRALTLPGTKTNHQLFEHIDQAQAVVEDAHKLLPARAEVNSIPILAGQAQLEKAILSRTPHGLKASSYQVSFVGNNADWFQQIGALLVRDLDWDTFTLSIAGYNTKTDSDPTTAETAFIVMRWKPWEDDTRVNYTELTPVLFLWQILTKAFQSIGYKLESIFTQDPFNRLVIPVPLKLDGDYAENFINVRVSKDNWYWTNFGYPEDHTEILPFDDETTPPNHDGGNNHVPGGTYTCPIKALYEVKLTGDATLDSIIIDPFETDFTNKFFVYVNGVEIIESGVDVPSNSTFELSWVAKFEIGDEIQIRARSVGTNVFGVYVNAVLEVTAEKDSWEIGETLNFPYIIPGTWIIKDIIKDLTQIFNLKWETDVLSQTVTAWPADPFTASFRVEGDGAAVSSAFDGFFYQAGGTDLSQKIDISRGGEMNLITDRVQDFVLAWGTGDETVRGLEERSAANLYSARYRFPDNRFPKGANWLYTSFFAKTAHLQDTGISSGLNAVQIPLLYGKDYAKEPDADPDYALNPRLLYFAGRRGGDDGYISIYDPTTSATSAYELPAAWQVNYNDPSAADWSLSFSDEVTNYGGTVRGLFKSMHLQATRRIEEGRRYTMNIFWNEGDISELSFRQPLRIDGTRFLLEKIDGYTPLAQGASKTEMILDIIPSTTDAAKVSGPVLLQGATPGALTTLGSITGVIGGAGTSVRVLRYRQLIQEATTNVITLPGSSGILEAPDPYIALTINQNGKILMPVLEWTIVSGTVTIDPDTHFEGCNYHLTVHETI